jgi:hypothetical protein
MKELTLLEKFAAGWEIRSHDGTKLDHVYKHLTKDYLYCFWADGDKESYTIAEFNAAIFTCTPPRDRRWVNVWWDDVDGKVYLTNEVDGNAASTVREVKYNIPNHISTLCIERVDGRWVLVDEKGGDK